MSQSFLQLLARVSPSAGCRRPNQWTHQEASCDSKFLIQFLLTLKIDQTPAWALASKWAYFACLGHVSSSGSRIKMFTWPCLNSQGKKFLYFQAKANPLLTVCFLILHGYHSFLLNAAIWLTEMLLYAAHLTVTNSLLLESWSSVRENTWR